MNVRVSVVVGDQCLMSCSNDWGFFIRFLPESCLDTMKEPETKSITVNMKKIFNTLKQESVVLYCGSKKIDVNSSFIKYGCEFMSKHKCCDSKLVNYMNESNCAMMCRPFPSIPGFIKLFVLDNCMYCLGNFATKTVSKTIPQKIKEVIADKIKILQPYFQIANCPQSDESTNILIKMPNPSLWTLYEWTRVAVNLRHS